MTTTTCYLIGRRITGESWELSNLEYWSGDGSRWSADPNNDGRWFGSIRAARALSASSEAIVLCDRVEIPGEETIELMETPGLDPLRACVVRSRERHEDAVWRYRAAVGWEAALRNARVYDRVARFGGSEVPSGGDRFQVRDGMDYEIRNIRRVTTPARVEIRPVRILP